jgi:voltage-gated potassium channel
MARIRIVTRLRDNRAKSSRILLGVSLLIFSTLVGVVGFMTLEDYQLLEAFYMTIITLSTVGFTEVKNLSDEGRLFTTVYIIFNLGIFAYSISIITTYIIEGEFRDIFHNYMISKQVRRMNQHIIVCGYGRNGRKACDELRRDKRPFVLIENNPDLLDDKLAGAKDFHYIIGDATVDDTLLAAGIERAEALITTLPRDADNV